MCVVYVVCVVHIYCMYIVFIVCGIGVVYVVCVVPECCVWYLYWVYGVCCVCMCCMCVVCMLGKNRNRALRGEKNVLGKGFIRELESNFSGWSAELVGGGGKVVRGKAGSGRQKPDSKELRALLRDMNFIAFENF